MTKMNVATPSATLLTAVYVGSTGEFAPSPAVATATLSEFAPLPTVATAKSGEFAPYNAFMAILNSRDDDDGDEAWETEETDE